MPPQFFPSFFPFLSSSCCRCCWMQQQTTVVQRPCIIQDSLSLGATEPPTTDAAFSFRPLVDPPSLAAAAPVVSCFVWRVQNPWATAKYVSYCDFASASWPNGYAAPCVAERAHERQL